MDKILYINNESTSKLLTQVNDQLELKNRMLKLIITNPEKKTTVATRQKKQTRYEDQIALLENLKSLIHYCRTREDLQKINSLIEYYNRLA
ncbi:hypothetical protein [Fredinandcohnia sp. 179-A 10B2 NHS]|uniref:hypothetical protein n=1 Tax=Fredinandcohnia sp. 179-A 10B2 NHS TaxID=3235176 RepID=UPI0039A2235F